VEEPENLVRATQTCCTPAALAGRSKLMTCRPPATGAEMAFSKPPSS